MSWAAPLLLLLAQPLVITAAADDLWGAATVPGGVNGAWRVIRNVPTERTAPSFLIDLARTKFSLVIDDGGLGPLQALPRYFDYLIQLQGAIGRFPDGFVLTPVLNQDRKRRGDLENALQLLNIRLVTSRGQLQVQRTDEDTRTIADWDAAAGIDVPGIVNALNRGERVRVMIPQDIVPLPLPALWKSILSVDPEQAVQFLAADSKALLLYTGLMATDHDTLAWINGHPAVFKDLYTGNGGAWAAFGRSFQIRNGVVRTPGEAAQAIWEDLVGARVTAPEDFLKKLLSRDDGRLAYFYDSVAHLDAPRQRFVLGSHLAGSVEAKERLRYVKRVRDRWVDVAPEWKIADRPMIRPALDPALVVGLIDVRPDGTVGPDWWPSLLERVSGDSSWPEKPNDTLRAIRPRRADAEWALDWLFQQSAEVGSRFRALRFLQRCFPDAARDSAAAIEISLRALTEMPALALAIERMGVRDPRVFESAARAARALTSAGDPVDVIPALRAWQGSLAVVEQLARHGVVSDQAASRLLVSLARAAPARPDRASGVTGVWVSQELMPALGVAAIGDEIPDETTLLKGLFASRAAAPARFRWEGLDYQIDLLGPTAGSVVRIREAAQGPRLESIVTLARADRMLEKGLQSLDQLAGLIRSLEPIPAALKGAVDGLNRPVTIAADLEAAIGVFRRIRAVKDLPRASRYRPEVQTALDQATALAMPAIAYALAVSPVKKPPALYADAAASHEFGIGLQQTRWETIAWSPPQSVPRARGGLALQGSMLGIDLTLAAERLFRFNATPPEGMFVPANDYPVLVQRASLRARATDWEAEGQAVSAAVERGRVRTDTWRQSTLDAGALAAELARAGFSEWRQNLIVWAATRSDWDTLARLISPTDWYRLGTRKSLPPAWGQSAVTFDGCWCLRAPSRQPLEDWLGRDSGHLAGESQDLAIQLSVRLVEIGVPQALLEPMYQVAIPDALDNIAPFGPGDWEAFGWARALTKERVEEYLQGLRQLNVVAPSKLPLAHPEALQ